MARITYDQEFKKIIIEESLKNGLGYKKISKKYNIAIQTARNWIKKAREFNNSVNVTNEASNNELKLIDVTKSIKEPSATFPINNQKYEIELNGNKLKLDLISLKTVIEVLKND